MASISFIRKRYFYIFVFIAINAILGVFWSWRSNYRTTNSWIGKAYIISSKIQLHREILEAAKICGFQPQIIPPKLPFAEQYDYSKDRMYKECIGIKGRSLLPFNVSGATNLSLAELSLVCSHRHVMDIISQDSSMSDSDWALIMEDDAALNPKVDKSRALFYVENSVKYARQYNPVEGFIYFGICRGSCSNRFSGFLFDRKFTIGSKCYGYCTHAYAITKYTARNLFGLMYTDKFLFNNSFVQIDQAMNNYFGQANRSLHALVAGFNIPSPRVTEHVGLMYQWKRTGKVNEKGTSLRSNLFQPQTCFIMRGDGGSIPALLQQYAVLIGLCIARNDSIHPLQCASFVSPQKNPIFDVFSERFNVRKVACSPNNVVVTDSQILKEIPVRDAISRVKYGSTFVGPFKNAPLYPGLQPWLRQVLDTASPYDQSQVVADEKSVSTSAWFRLPEWMSMTYSATMDSVSCAPSATKVCVHVSTDGYSDEDIALAGSFYVAAFHHLSRIYPEGIAMQLFLDKKIKESDLRGLLSLQSAPYHAPICMIPHRKRYRDVVEGAGDSSGVGWEAEHDVWTIQQLQGCSRIVVAKSEVGWWAAYLSTAEVFISSQAKRILPSWTVI